jgi:nucleoside-diphosphate-sugar epimerase
MAPRTILITGATGNQGGAVVDALLSTTDSDFAIVALTRNPQSPGATKLTSKSPRIKVVQGDLNHPKEIFEAVSKTTGEKVWGVFMVQVTPPTALLTNALADMMYPVRNRRRRHSRPRAHSRDELHRRLR